MGPQELPAAVASRGGVRSQGRQLCSIHGDILVEIIKLDSTGFALESLSRSAIRKNDIMALKLDMQIFKSIRARWFQPGNRAPVYEIACRYQQAIDEEAVPVGDVKVA